MFFLIFFWDFKENKLAAKTLPGGRICNLYCHLSAAALCVKLYSSQTALGFTLQCKAGESILISTAATQPSRGAARRVQWQWWRYQSLYLKTKISRLFNPYFSIALLPCVYQVLVSSEIFSTLVTLICEICGFKLHWLALLRPHPRSPFYDGGGRQSSTDPHPQGKVSI